MLIKPLHVELGLQQERGTCRTANAGKGTNTYVKGSEALADALALGKSGAAVEQGKAVPPSIMMQAQEWS